MSAKLKTQDLLCPGGMPAFIAHPIEDKPVKLPVVILMHERYGLVQHTKDLAMRCARDGFLALAPNFFFKHPDQGKLNAGDSRYDLKDTESNGLLRACMTMLGDYPYADLTRVAVAGYCQTGRHPMVFAAEVPIAAAVVWYGGAAPREWVVSETQPKPLDELIAQIQCPVFGAFGALDHIISLDDVCTLRASLERHRKSYDIHVYDGAPHGWLNDTMPGRYRREQAEAGWAAQQRFLTKVLAPGYKQKAVEWSFECVSQPDYDYSKNVRLE